MQIFNSVNHRCHSRERLYESNVCVRMGVEMGSNNPLLSGVILKTRQSEAQGVKATTTQLQCSQNDFQCFETSHRWLRGYGLGPWFLNNGVKGAKLVPLFRQFKTNYFSHFIN